MNGNDQVMGIVNSGQLRILLPEQSAGQAVGLTRIAMQEAIAPESREINLAEYEGLAIMVHGHHAGEWIYRAEVLDVAGRILTAVVEKTFS